MFSPILVRKGNKLKKISCRVKKSLAIAESFKVSVARTLQSTWRYLVVWIGERLNILKHGTTEQPKLGQQNIRVLLSVSGKWVD